MNPVPQGPASEGQSAVKSDRMEHNGTLLETSPAKMKAIQALAAGQTVVGAAAAAKVGRTTVYRWFKKDFAFQAEVNRRRSELWLGSLATLERLSDKAAACVEKAIENGDVKAALEILRRRDTFTRGPIGSQDPAELAEQTNTEAAQREAFVTMQAMAAELGRIMAQKGFGAILEALPPQVVSGRLEDAGDPGIPSPAEPGATEHQKEG